VNKTLIQLELKLKVGTKMDRNRFRKSAWLCKLRWRRPEMAIALSHNGLYSEPNFREKLIQERRRADRSRKPLLLMVLEPERLNDVNGIEKFLQNVAEEIRTSVRGTDACGLLDNKTLIGVILTEVEQDKTEIAQKVISNKIKERLANILSNDVLNSIKISFHIYPDLSGDEESFDMTFYPELNTARCRWKIGGILNRVIDIIGSVVALLCFSPFFLLIPVCIKTTSNGPVFFYQERVGRNGKKFKLLKFRSMYIDNDDVIHREYIRQLIKGGVLVDNTSGIYKIQGDPRVTRLGRYLRRYSIDELPQLINVLKGDMSLVGPRPPIRYEVENYGGWQRNRLMGKKPGITGLWQVVGRSSTTFDDMVRLDLRYLNGWTIVLDLKILIRTPLAVLKCKGAY
jgi:lipopolysaccharide/colanic/teichoic acid biosynthesis glycosyltransferase/GGDEF domain-containing protein